METSDDTNIPQNVESSNSTGNYTMIELRFRIPSFVADWLDVKAGESFKYRNNYVKDVLIAMYRRDNGRS